MSDETSPEAPEDCVLTDHAGDGVGRVTLNRAHIHNAFDEVLIARLTQAFQEMAADDSVHMVVLEANGRSFSAGADLDWMRRAAEYDLAENEEEALRLAELLEALAGCPKPVLALVQGAAIAGGMGLVACCDLVIAVKRARFSLSEVRLGLIPATISPHVMAAIGSRRMRCYFLTAEPIDSETAYDLGLVHILVEDEEALAEAGKKMIEELSLNGPGAMAETKAFMRSLAGREQSPEAQIQLAGRLARRRATDEGKEGLTAFFEKRSAGWVAND